MERNIFFVFLWGTAIIILVSCQSNPRNIPFPSQEMEYPQPMIQNIKFSKEKHIQWKIPLNSRAWKNAKFKFEKIPLGFFTMGGYKPLREPIKEIGFDPDILPTTDLHWKMAPIHKVSFKKSILGQPNRTKASWPHIKNGAQHPIYEYGLDNGLSTGGGTSSMLQDSRGLIWIATLNGLFRFDGEYFEQFATSQGSEYFNMIHRLQEDKKGKIWASSEMGLDIIDLNERTIKHLDSTLVPNINHVRMMMKDTAGCIWMATRNGIDILDGETGELKYLSGANGLSHNGIFGLLADDSGRVWIHTETGVEIVDLHKDKIINLTEPLGLNTNKVISLFKDTEGNMWIGTKNGIYIISVKNKTLSHISKKNGLKRNAFSDFSEGIPGQVWAWAEDQTGVDIVDLNFKMISHLNGDNEGEYWYKYLRDNQRNIWMDDISGTNLDMMNLANAMNSQIMLNKDFRTNSIENFMEDSQGRIWLSNGSGGIYCIDPVNNNIKLADSNAGLPKTYGFSLLSEDGRGRIWVSGTETEGIFIVDTKTGILNHLTTAVGLSSNQVRNFFKDNLGKMWICTGHGISVLDPDSNRLKYLTKDQGLSSDDTRSGMQDLQGNIWITSSKGVDVIDPKTETLKHLMIAGEKDIDLGYEIIEDESHRIWISSYGHGLYMINPDGEKLIHFTMREGLSSDQLTSVEAKNNVIYAGTANGLSMVSSGKEVADLWHVKTYGKPQLFSHVDFNPFSLITKKGQFLWAVNGDGVLIMDEPRADSLIPPVYITSIDIMGKARIFLKDSGNQPAYLEKKDISWDSLTSYWNLPVNLLLSSNQNFISFHFTGMRLRNIDKTRYRYVLEGIDKTWSEISDKPFTETYRNLTPGKYLFKVTCAGMDGLWSVPAEMKFIVLPPWWHRWWAYLTYFAVFSGFILLIYRNHINRLRARQRKQIVAAIETQEQERKRISRDLHDDIGTKLSALKLFISALDSKARVSGNEEIVSLARISDQFIKEAVGDLRHLLMNLSPLILEEFGYAVAMETLAGKINETRLINFELNIFGFPTRLEKSYELALYRISQELVNNVLKHANAKNISLQVLRRDQQIILIMEDNGRGFVFSDHKDGYGLRNLDTRTKLLGGELNIESTPGTGTTVRIEIPYNLR